MTKQMQTIVNKIIDYISKIERGEDELIRCGEVFDFKYKNKIEKLEDKLSDIILERRIRK